MGPQFLPTKTLGIQWSTLFSVWRDWIWCFLYFGQMPQMTHFNGSLVETSFIKKTSHQTWQWAVCHIAVLTVDFQASAWFPEGKAAPKNCQRLIGKKRPRLEIPQGLWLVTFDCAMLHHRTSAIERYQSCTAAMLQLAVFEGHMTSASVREGPILRGTRWARSSWRFLVSAGLNAATNRQIAIRTIDAFG